MMLNFSYSTYLYAVLMALPSMLFCVIKEVQRLFTYDIVRDSYVIIAFYG